MDPLTHDASRTAPIARTAKPLKFTTPQARGPNRVVRQNIGTGNRTPHDLGCTGDEQIVQ
jgi:hypothetical protein